MIKRYHVLSLVLLLLLILSGILYNKGYWNSWEDERDEIYEEIMVAIHIDGASPRTKELFSTCMADELVKIAKAISCPHYIKRPFIDQINECMGENEAMASFMLGNSIQACQFEVLKKIKEETPS